MRITVLCCILCLVIGLGAGGGIGYWRCSVDMCHMVSGADEHARRARKHALELERDEETKGMARVVPPAPVQ
jgi:hypothetical protein